MNGGSLRSRIFRGIHLSVFKYWLTKNSFAGPKGFRGFPETGSRYEGAVEIEPMEFSCLSLAAYLDFFSQTFTLQKFALTIQSGKQNGYHKSATVIRKTEFSFWFSWYKSKTNTVFNFGWNYLCCFLLWKSVVPPTKEKLVSSMLHKVSLTTRYVRYVEMDSYMKKKIIYFKQAAISQMEKELNQRTQDAKERDKEVCTPEWLGVTQFFVYVVMLIN